MTPSTSVKENGIQVSFTPDPTPFAVGSQKVGILQIGSHKFLISHVNTDPQDIKEMIEIIDSIPFNKFNLFVFSLNNSSHFRLYNDNKPKWTINEVSQLANDFILSSTPEMTDIINKIKIVEKDVEELIKKYYSLEGIEITPQNLQKKITELNRELMHLCEKIQEKIKPLLKQITTISLKLPGNCLLTADKRVELILKRVSFFSCLNLSEFPNLPTIFSFNEEKENTSSKTS